MPINETIVLVASFTTDGGKTLSKRASDVTIIDTSNNELTISIDRNWKTTAASSYYGGFYIKPTLDLMEAINSTYGGVDLSKTYVFIIASDIALIGNHELISAVVGDNLPAGAKVRVENYGLIFGRGGNNAVSGMLNGNSSFVIPQTQPHYGGYAAQSSSASVIINNYGGISGGGGGSGQNRHFNHSQVISTQATEYCSVILENIVPGAGAPFGNTTRGYYDVNDVFLMNPDLPWFDGRVNTFNANEMNNAYSSELNYNRLVYCRTSYQTDEIIITDTGLNNTRAFKLNRTPTWWQDRKGAGLGTSINYAYDYKENYLRNSRPPFNGDPTYQGGYLDSSTPAGLFRGGSGGNPEVNAMSDLFITRFIACMTAAESQVWRDRWRGAPGGNIGKNGNRGLETPLWTMRFQPRATPKTYQYLEGAQGTIYGVGATANNYWQSVALSGAAAGALKSGNVVINNMVGGAMGGDAVIAKYDPNGTFDTNARLAANNISKTFYRIYTSQNNATPVKYATVPSAGYYNSSNAAITSIGIGRTAYLKFTVDKAEAGAELEIMVGGWNNWPPANGNYFFSSISTGRILPNSTLRSDKNTDVQGFTANKYIITIDTAINSATEFTFPFNLGHSGNANRTTEQAYLWINNAGKTLQQKPINVTEVGL